jgi:hypothetical protein
MLDGQHVLTGAEDDETPQSGGARPRRWLAVAPQHVEEADSEQRDEYRKGVAGGRQDVDTHLHRSSRAWEQEIRAAVCFKIDKGVDPSGGGAHSKEATARRYQARRGRAGWERNSKRAAARGEAASGVAASQRQAAGGGRQGPRGVSVSRLGSGPEGYGSRDM